MKPLKVIAFAVASSTLVSAMTAAEPNLVPLMTVKDKVVLQTDFAKPTELPKTIWQKRQGTRWSIENKLLVGIPSSAEYQANKSHHRGLEPRLSVPATPKDFVLQISFRFLDGAESTIVPFVEFGHHICRLKFSSETGLSLVADHESVRLAHFPKFRYEPGKWYHMLAELKSGEFVAQFENGPTVYAKHECFAKPVSSGGNGLGVAGPRGGKVEIEHLSIWAVKANSRAGWSDRLKKIPTHDPQPTGKLKKAK